MGSLRASSSVLYVSGLELAGDDVGEILEGPRVTRQ